MFFLTLGFALFGIFKYRTWDYWKWIALAFLWSWLVTILFSGGGTLANPVGDGLIMMFVRQQTNEGPQIALFAIGVLVGGYGGLLALLGRALFVGRKAQQASAQQSSTGIPQKLFEAGLLSGALIGFQIYSAQQPLDFSSLLDDRPRQASSVKSGGDEQSLPTFKRNGFIVVEESPAILELQKAASELNRTLPRRLDDITTLESVTVNGREVTYQHSVSSIANRNAAEDYLNKNIPKEICGDRVMRESIRDHGVVYKYAYRVANTGTTINVLVYRQKCLDIGM